MKFYQEKNSGYYAIARTEILPLLPEKAERIFEIGCADGSTLLWVREQLASSWAGGVELFEDAAEKARQRIDWVSQGNFEAMELPFDDNSMDLILCLDVLEHLVDPWAVIKRLHGLLKPGGVIIASIPNIRHAKVSLALLCRGEWNYTDVGILDRTHIRFFTRSTAKQLVESSGLKIDKVLSSSSDTWIWSWFNLFTFSLFKPLLEYQYLIRARKPEIDRNYSPGTS
ncbi:MAG: class I SAM-dependent methyltransferase [Geobacteraceae bacterium]|nr:class I SAM-dependent methyltransferase [Geobacteraceae bacterium]